MMLKATLVSASVAIAVGSSYPPQFPAAPSVSQTAYGSQFQNSAQYSNNNNNNNNNAQQNSASGAQYNNNNYAYFNNNIAPSQPQQPNYFSGSQPGAQNYQPAAGFQSPPYSNSPLSAAPSAPSSVQAAVDMDLPVGAGDPACPADKFRTCPDGTELYRDPDLGCDFQICPTVTDGFVDLTSSGNQEYTSFGPAPPSSGSATGSCDGFCGQKDPNTQCFCDSVCNFHGDCCEDYSTKCANKSLVGLPAPSTPVGSSAPSTAGSCLNSCGSVSVSAATSYSAAITCWCDSMCSKNQDCCEDFSETCGVTGDTGLDMPNAPFNAPSNNNYNWLAQLQTSQPQSLPGLATGPQYTPQSSPYTQYPGALAQNYQNSAFNQNPAFNGAVAQNYQNQNAPSNNNYNWPATGPQYPPQYSPQNPGAVAQNNNWLAQSSQPQGPPVLATGPQYPPQSYIPNTQYSQNTGAVAQNQNTQPYNSPNSASLYTPNTQYSQNAQNAQLYSQNSASNQNQYSPITSSQSFTSTYGFPDSSSFSKNFGL